jgi:hypothetical protein
MTKRKKGKASLSLSFHVSATHHQRSGLNLNKTDEECLREKIPRSAFPPSDEEPIQHSDIIEQLELEREAPAIVDTQMEREAPLLGETDDKVVSSGVKRLKAMAFRLWEFLLRKKS